MHGSQRSGIPIVTGNPAGNAPASFTRFALPFIWSLTENERSKPSPVYRVTPAERLCERRRYFTPETARALFDRASWLELKELDKNDQGSDAKPISGPFVLQIGQRAVTISVAPPRIVLFEAESRQMAPEIAKTGFLLVDVSFPPSNSAENAPTLDDLMIVNELFRYWRSPYPDHAKDERPTSNGDTFCYESVMKELEGKVPYLTRWNRLLEFPVEIDGKRWRLVARDACNEAEAWASHEPSSSPYVTDPFTTVNPKRTPVIDNSTTKKRASRERGWIAYTDERAFVWTCALTQNGARDLTGLWHSRDPKLEGEWVRLLNVDRPSRDETTEFEREWIGERTYERWKHCGTLYGFNTHSGAMIAKECHNPPLWRHFGELYFDQVLLLLYLRVCLFRFSEALAEISKEIGTPSKNDFANFRDLRRSFVFLTNLYRFPLLSSQQQGIEMYAAARKSLDIDELFGEVQAEIETTHEMFELIGTSKMAAVTTDLTYAVLAAGVLATVMAFLAAEDLGVKSPREPVLQFFDRLPWLMPSGWLIVFSFPAILLLWLLAWWRQRR